MSEFLRFRPRNIAALTLASSLLLGACSVSSKETSPRRDAPTTTFTVNGVNKPGLDKTHCLSFERKLSLSPLDADYLVPSPEANNFDNAYRITRPQPDKVQIDQVEFTPPKSIGAIEANLGTLTLADNISFVVKDRDAIISFTPHQSKQSITIENCAS